MSVLVGPSQPGNVGMISRAMANFEVEELYLVNPEYDRSDPENGSFERRFAMQDHAKTILSEAKVCGTLTQALAGCNSAVGFTRRRGNMRSGGNDVVVGGLAQLGATQRMALVFGREADGLRSDELLLCTHTCEIPTSGRQGSMSLPAACTVALSRTFESALAPSRVARQTKAHRLESSAATRPRGVQRACHRHLWSGRSRMRGHPRPTSTSL